MLFRRYNHYIFIILGCSPDQGYAPDVNFFNDLRIGSSGCNRVFKWIQVNNDKINARDFVFFDLGLVLRIISAGKDSTENFWMKCFHTASENRGISGKFFNSGYLHSLFFNKIFGPTRGNYAY